MRGGIYLIKFGLTQSTLPNPGIGYERSWVHETSNRGSSIVEEGSISQNHVADLKRWVDSKPHREGFSVVGLHFVPYRIYEVERVVIGSYRGVMISVYLVGKSTFVVGQ